jgi:type II secretory pathway predicted ATPase ExeA
MPSMDARPFQGHRDIRRNGQDNFLNLLFSSMRRYGFDIARGRTHQMLRYYQHFGLQRDPFLDTSDPQFYLEVPTVRRSIRRVLMGVEESRGLTVVMGPPGSGKTSLSSNVEQVLLTDESIVIGKILDPSFANDVEFLLAIARVFGLDVKSRSSSVLKNAIKNYLYDTAIVEDKTLVLLIDEAQNLSTDGLETLRLLLNFQVPQKKLLNLILFGEEDLAQLIAERKNFSDHVDTYVRLEPLDASSSGALVEHRLMKAGKLPLVAIVTPDALECAIAAGGGLARRLTNVVRCAMIEAADRGAEVVSVDHVVAALRARGMKCPAAVRAIAPESEPVFAAVAAPSISGDIDVKQPAHVEQPTFFARFLAWFP